MLSSSNSEMGPRVHRCLTFAYPLLCLSRRFSGCHAPLRSRVVAFRRLLFSGLVVGWVRSLSLAAASPERVRFVRVSGDACCGGQRVSGQTRAKRLLCCEPEIRTALAFSHVRGHSTMSYAWVCQASPVLADCQGRNEIFDIPLPDRASRSPSSTVATQHPSGCMKHRRTPVWTCADTLQLSHRMSNHPGKGAGACGHPPIAAPPNEACDT